MMLRELEYPINI